MSTPELLRTIISRVYSQRAYTIEVNGEVLVAYAAASPTDYRRAESAALGDALRLGLGASCVFVRTCAAVEA